MSCHGRVGSIGLYRYVGLIMVDTLPYCPPMDWHTYRVFAMYADGVDVVDIANLLSCSTTKIYATMNEHPQDKDEAKRRRTEKRNAKYRRVGALAVDIQIRTLEGYQELLDEENILRDELSELELEAVKGDYEHLSTKENVPEEIRLHTHKIQQLRQRLSEADMIRDSLKTIVLAGESAEKRADLNEGKATERTEFTGNMTVADMMALAESVRARS